MSIHETNGDCEYRGHSVTFQLENVNYLAKTYKPNRERDAIVVWLDVIDLDKRNLHVRYKHTNQKWIIKCKAIEIVD